MEALRLPVCPSIRGASLVLVLRSNTSSLHEEKHGAVHHDLAET